MIQDDAPSALGAERAARMPTARRAWRRLALRIGVSGLTLAALFLVLPRQELWAAFRHLSVLMWAAGVAAYVCLHLLGVTKYRLTVNLTGAGLPLVRCIRCYYGGLFGSLILPSIVGGDVIRAGLAFKGARSRTGLVMGSLLDRLIDMAGLGVLATLGALFLPDALGFVGRKVLVPAAATGGAGLAVLVTFWFLVPARRLPFRVRRRLVRLREACRPAIRRPAYLLAALALGICLQASLVVLNAVLGRVCGLECSLAVWFFVWPLAKLSAVLPITQGGVGVREAALAALFVPFGVPAALAVAAGLAFEAVILTGNLLGGPIALMMTTWDKSVALKPESSLGKSGTIPTCS